MGIENKINTAAGVEINREIRELSPGEILDQINRTLLYNFADGSRPISHEEKIKLAETKQVVQEIIGENVIDEEKNSFITRFQGNNGNSYNLDLLTGVVANESDTLCILSKNEKSFLYGLISNPGKIIGKSALNGILYPDQKEINEITSDNNERLWVIKRRLVKKLGDELG